jgi:glycosyltransferase involved in cell wall biosynthesis
MASPLISIITPCFNSARYIEACIGSVLAQTYPEIEHIVQDGASRDGTVAILEKYSGKIDWLSAPDKGQADGLDKAIRRSKGDILLVLNADDILLPDAAQWADTQMMAHPDAAVIYGDVILIDEDGKVFGQFVAPDYDFPSVLCVEKVIPAQAAFIRRSALQMVGLGADASLDTCPDYEMFVRLGLRFPMLHVPYFVTNYRQYPRVMDGAAPRTVDRFVAAKKLVMDRVFDDPTTPENISRLRDRAYISLRLWASQEARSAGMLGQSWAYFAEALNQYSLLGKIANRAIRVAMAVYRDIRQRQRPAPGRVLHVGFGLLRDTLISMGFRHVGLTIRIGLAIILISLVVWLLFWLSDNIWNLF